MGLYIYTIMAGVVTIIKSVNHFLLKLWRLRIDKLGKSKDFS